MEEVAQTNLLEILKRTQKRTFHGGSYTNEENICYHQESNCVIVMEKKRIC